MNESPVTSANAQPARRVRRDVVSGESVAAARAAGKLVGILAIAPIGGLRVRQAVGLGCALLPMSTLALMLQHDVAKHFPEFGSDMTAVFLAALIIMELMGPLAVQWGLRYAGETEPGTDSVITPTQSATNAPGA